MPARRLIVAAWAVALLVSLPVRAAAQKSAFIDAFIEFHSALPGIFGDEGSQVTAALARMSASLDVWEQAGRDLKQSLRARAGTTPADVALVDIDQQQLGAALEEIERAIAADTRRPSYRVLQGLLLQALNRPADAGIAFEAAHTLDPGDSIATYLLAASRADAGRSDAIPPLALALTSVAERGGTVGQGPFPRLTLVDDLSAQWPIFSPPLYADGFAAMAAGRFHEALDRFRDAAARDPLVVDEAAHTPLVSAGIAALRQGRGPEAISSLEAAVRVLAESPEAHRDLGIAYRAMNRLPESIGQFEAAVRLAPRVQRARLALGAALMEAGRLGEAERVLRETIEVLPASGDARWALAQVYERLDRGPEAIDTLEAALPLTVMAGKSHLYWRIAQLAHGYRRDYPRVISVVSQRTWLVLNEPAAHKDLGMAYYRAGRMDEALTELAMAALLGQQDAEMLSAVGQIHLAAGRLDAAERATRRAVMLDGNLPQARYVLGSTLRRLGRVEDATRELNAFRRLQQAAFHQQQRTFEIDTTVHQARRLASAGRLDEAAAAYEKAGALGAAPAIYRELAAVYARLGRTADRARALARAGN
jgi:tetratricopeptide (TPR) repeat protein